MSDQSMSERYDHVDRAVEREEERKAEVREQRRFEAAKEILAHMIGSGEYPKADEPEAVRISVRCADALLAALARPTEAPDAKPAE